MLISYLSEVELTLLLICDGWATLWFLRWSSSAAAESESRAPSYLLSESLKMLLGNRSLMNNRYVWGWITASRIVCCSFAAVCLFCRGGEVLPAHHLPAFALFIALSVCIVHYFSSLDSAVPLNKAAVRGKHEWESRTLCTEMRLMLCFYLIGGSISADGL